MAVAEGGGPVMQRLCMRGTAETYWSLPNIAFIITCIWITYFCPGCVRTSAFAGRQHTVACCLRLSTAVALAAAAVAVAAAAVALATAAVTFAAAAVALAATTAALASAAASQSRRSLQVSAAAVDRSQLRRGSS